MLMIDLLLHPETMKMCITFHLINLRNLIKYTKSENYFGGIMLIDFYSSNEC